MPMAAPTAFEISLQERRILLILCIVSAVALFALRADELSGMSTGFASHVFFNKWYFFPHHLLYQPIVRVFTAALTPLGCDVTCAGQIHSILWAVATIGATYLITLRLSRSIGCATGAAVFLFFSHGFWVFSTQLEPYLPVVGIDAILAAFLICRPRGALTLKDLAIVSGLLSFSLFFHQANLFFLIPIADYLIVVEGKGGIWSIIKISGVSGVFTLLVNVWIFRSIYPGESFGDFYRWLNYYGTISTDAHGSWRDLLNMGRVRSAIRSTSAALVTGETKDIVRSLGFVIAPIIAALAGWNLVVTWRKWPESYGRLILLLWLFTFGFFFFWWMPFVTKFFVMLTVPVAILGALAISDMLAADRIPRLGKQAVVGFAFIVVAAIAVVNFSSSIWPLATSRSPFYVLTAKLDDATPDECSIYIERKYQGLMGYYFHRDSRPFNLMFLKHNFSRVNPAVSQAIRVSLDMEHESCGVMPLYWISPEYYDGRKKTNRMVDGGDGAESENPPWSSYISWILDVQTTSSGEVTYDGFRVVQSKDGDSFLYIDRSQRNVAGSLGNLLSQVEATVNSNPFGVYAGDEYYQAESFRDRVFGYF
jgi:hypothetical protein